MVVINFTLPSQSSLLGATPAANKVAKRKLSASDGVEVSLGVEDANDAGSAVAATTAVCKSEDSAEPSLKNARR